MMMSMDVMMMSMNVMMSMDVMMMSMWCCLRSLCGDDCHHM